MDKVFLIRHAESESNIGGVFEHQNIVKITKNGKKQAEDLVEVLEKPDRIICSRYIRTIETAEPLMNKYPDSEIHLWIDTHEFQPIDSKKNIGITTLQKEELHRKYWTTLDPFYNDGGDAESFKEFVERVNETVVKMKALKGINYIFTHGNFIRCVLTLLTNFNDYNLVQKDPDSDLYLKIMEKFTESYRSGELAIKNLEIFNLTKLLKAYN